MQKWKNDRSKYTWPDIVKCSLIVNAYRSLKRKAQLVFEDLLDYEKYSHMIKAICFEKKASGWRYRLICTGLEG